MYKSATGPPVNQQGDKVLEAWLIRLQRPGLLPHITGFHPVIQAFQILVEQDAEIYMDFHRMFEQIPREPRYDRDPSGMPQVSDLETTASIVQRSRERSQVRDYKTMLSLFNVIITTAPCFEENGLVGFPINAILNWPMATPAGLALFVNPKVNAQIKRMFDVWSRFLSSPESRYVLTGDDNGWFGPSASKVMPGFASTFLCEPSEEYWGFASWDDFFTRRLRKGARPVHRPDDDSIITSACESSIYRIAYNVQARDRFWLKGEPYSLEHILNNDELTPSFAGGTI